MCAYGAAAAHMHHDQVQLFVGDTGFLGVSSGNSLLVQGMEDTSSGKLGASRISGNRLQLIYNNRVNDKGRNADGIADFPCQDAAQVGSVLSLIADFQIVKQIVAHLVGAARDGLKQSAAPYDEIQGMDVKILLLQEVRDNFLTEILLVDDGGVL